MLLAFELITSFVEVSTSILANSRDRRVVLEERVSGDALFVFTGSSGVTVATGTFSYSSLRLYFKLTILPLLESFEFSQLSSSTMLSRVVSSKSRGAASSASRVVSSASIISSFSTARRVDRRLMIPEAQFDFRFRFLIERVSLTF
jgi:hypothetical protein